MVNQFDMNDPHDGMRESVNGDYVLKSDYDKLKAWAELAIAEAARHFADGMGYPEDYSDYASRIMRELEE